MFASLPPAELTNIMFYSRSLTGFSVCLTRSIICEQLFAFHFIPTSYGNFSELISKGFNISNMQPSRKASATNWLFRLHCIKLFAHSHHFNVFVQSFLAKTNRCLNYFKSYCIFFTLPSANQPFLFAFGCKKCSNVNKR